MTQTMTFDPYDQTGHPAPSGRHPVNIGHLVMGMAFVGLVGVWALIQGDVVDGDDIRWLLPVPWVLAGIVGLLATTMTGRDRWATRQTGWVVPGEPEHPSTDTAHPTEPTEPTQPEQSEEIR